MALDTSAFYDFPATFLETTSNLTLKYLKATFLYDFDYHGLVTITLWNDGLDVVVKNPCGRLELESFDESVKSLLGGEKREDLIKLMVIVLVGNPWNSRHNRAEPSETRDAIDNANLIYEAVCQNLQKHCYLTDVQSGDSFVKESTRTRDLTQDVLRLLEQLIPEKPALFGDFEGDLGPKTEQVYSGTSPSIEDIDLRSQISKSSLKSKRDLKVYSGTTPSGTRLGTLSKISMKRIVFEEFRAFPKTPEEIPVNEVKVQFSVYFKVTQECISSSPGSRHFSMQDMEDFKIFNLSEGFSQVDEFTPLFDGRILNVNDIRVLWNPQLAIAAFFHSSQGTSTFWYGNGHFRSLFLVEELTGLRKLQWSQDGRFLLVLLKADKGLFDLILNKKRFCTVRIYDVETGRMVHELKTKSLRVSALGWVTNDMYCYREKESDELFLVEKSDQSMSPVNNFHQLPSSKKITWSPDGTTLVAFLEKTISCLRDGKVTTFKIAATSRIHWLPGKPIFWILSGLTNYQNVVIHLFNVETGQRSSKEISFDVLQIINHFSFDDLGAIIFVDSASDLHFVSVESGEETFAYQLQEAPFKAFHWGESKVTFLIEESREGYPVLLKSVTVDFSDKFQEEMELEEELEGS